MYNAFFSKHGLRLKQNDSGIPSNCGSVAQIVRDALAQIGAEEKDGYKCQANQQNEMKPIDQQPQMMMDIPPPTNAMLPMLMSGQHLRPPLMDKHLPPPMHDGGSPPPGHDPMGPPNPNMHPPYPTDYGIHGPPRHIIR